MREALRFTGRVVSATISRIAHKWFVSLHVELEQLPNSCKNQASVGIDLGINKLAVLSTGEEKLSPKPLKHQLQKLKRKQRKLSRKALGSANRFKAKLDLAKLHYRIRCIRQDALHKLTSELTASYQQIAIEDFHVKGMLANHCLARAVSDMGFYEFRRQLEYKSQLYGNKLEIVDRWFPSSKKCSGCGALKKKKALSDRLFKCDVCELQIDRDLNAARNLKATVSSTENYAYGEEGADAILIE